MKKLIIVLFMFSLKLFPQGWSNSIELSFLNEPNLVMMDMFTNNQAIYLAVVDIYDDIRIYKVNTQGGVYSGFPKTITTDGQLPSITGSNGRIYISYLSDDSIRTKYYLDLGETWSQLPQLQFTTGNLCNGIDTQFETNYGLHISCSTQDWQRLYKTYYYL